LQEFPSIGTPLFVVDEADDNQSPRADGEKKGEAHPVVVVGVINDGLHDIRADDSALWDTYQHSRIVCLFSVE
jgi:hypothetical protein